MSYILKKDRLLFEISNYFYNFIKIVFYIFSLSISAKIKFYLPISVVPFTFQMFVLFLIIFNENRLISFLSIVSYILSGILNLPVFANFSGFAALLGPTGGYIIGFMFTSLFAKESRKENIKENGVFSNILVGNFIKGLFCIFTVYAFGFLGLLRFMNPKMAFISGILPFIIFDLYKLILAILLNFSWKKD